jgi:hypothetical protein
MTYAVNYAQDRTNEKHLIFSPMTETDSGDSVASLEESTVFSGDMAEILSKFLNKQIPFYFEDDLKKWLDEFVESYSHIDDIKNSNLRYSFSLDMRVYNEIWCPSLNIDVYSIEDEKRPSEDKRYIPIGYHIKNTYIPIEYLNNNYEYDPVCGISIPYMHILDFDIYEVLKTKIRDDFTKNLKKRYDISDKDCKNDEKLHEINNNWKDTF